MEKAQRAAAEMRGDVTVGHLDLADLSSVRRFADSVDTVDVLINNAGVLGLPLTRTVDGFETHIGTNHLGHFALTCLLGDRITDRVISVSSAMYVFGRLDLDDLNWHRRRYWKWAAYTQSKLANMLFVAELARRGMRAYASDPGAADTDITRDASGALGWLGRHTPKGRCCSTCSRRPRPRGPPSMPSTPNCPAGRISRRGSTSGAHPNTLSRITRLATRTWRRGCGTCRRSSRAVTGWG